MISTSTVFVIGAGANVSYGFSTGTGLLEKARQIDPRELMGNAGRQITAAQSSDLRMAIQDNMLPSIDALLEHRQDLWAAGKRVMATLLYKEESKANPGSTNEDWMALIFQYMSKDADSIERFGANRVSFVTFNYDRYLEHRLIRALVARYKVKPHEAWLALSDKILHVYGSLGDLPEQYEPGAATPATIVPLGAPEIEDVYHLGLALPIAEHAIKIVHDQVPGQDRVFTTARSRLIEAQQVFFLGFAFGKTNVERLSTHLILDRTIVQATTYGMTPAEVREAVLPAFPNKEMANQTADLTARPFLRNRVHMLQ